MVSPENVNIVQYSAVDSPFALSYKSPLMTIVDGHIHFDDLDSCEKFLDHVGQCGAVQFGALVLERVSNDHSIFHLPQAIWMKWKYPDRCFLFGGVDMTGIWDKRNAQTDVPLDEQLKELAEIGCDGLKLWMGKPQIRKLLSQPLDGLAYEPMLKFLEQSQFPTLWHVGDPPEFWSEHTVPLWARKNRWWYDETYPPKALIDREIYSVFAKYPKLNLILPHFFFLSDKLEEAAKLLDAHPSYCLDLAPGIEMLHNFTKNHAASREFFIRYAGQIIFGTDIGMGKVSTGIGRGPMVRRFLETDDVFPVPEDPYMTPDERPDLHGLKLPADALKKIFAENYYRVIGRRQPKPLNLPKAKAMLERLARRDHPVAKRVLDEMSS